MFFFQSASVVSIYQALIKPYKPCIYPKLSRWQIAGKTENTDIYIYIQIQSDVHRRAHIHTFTLTWNIYYTVDSRHIAVEYTTIFNTKRGCKAKASLTINSQKVPQN